MATFNIDGLVYTDKLPHSRVERLLYSILKNGGGGGGSTNATLLNDLIVTLSVGGVKIGDVFEKGTLLEDVIRNVIAAVLYPTFVAPSASISSPGNKILEDGAVSEVTFTVAFNRGNIAPAYGTSGYRSGPATGYILNNGAEQSGNTFRINVSQDNRSFQARVNYAEGDQPKDSSGADYESPLPAGSITTNTITYEFVNALWSNTVSIWTIAKEALVSKSAKQKVFIFPAQTIANPEVFDVPADFVVTAVEVLNTLSNQYEDCSSEFDISNTTHLNAAGESVAYKRYTDNRGYNADGRTIRIKWN